MITLLCPAKVNLYLRVVGRRPDGYHDLVTVMQPLSLADELTVAAGSPGLTLTCEHPHLADPEDNLVWRAARLFAEETGRELGVAIRLHKAIPLAAGLGGGSSDAAGTLLALNRMCGQPLGDDVLHRLAAYLGADVPFFLRRQPAVARGTGTELSPIFLPAYSYLLLNPGVPLSTRWVYDNLDLAGLPAAPAAETWDPDHPEDWVHNDLGPVALKKMPELETWLLRLHELGAWTQGISGSGPTVFGLFDTLEAAAAAGRTLRQTFGGWLAVAQGLTGLEEDTAWGRQVWTI